MTYPFPMWDLPTVPIAGSTDLFPVRHIYCVGRNYAEHAKEMGGDATKEPPFFFTKPADAVVPVVPPAVGRVAYPLATKNYHHEIELVVAIGARGVQVAPERAHRHRLRLRDRPRHDAARPAERHAREEAAVGHRQVVRAGRADRADPSGRRPGSWRAGAIALDVNGARRQQGDLADMIWDVPHTLAFLSQLTSCCPATSCSPARRPAWARWCPATGSTGASRACRRWRRS